MSVNPTIRLPGLPTWLDLEQCDTCGAKYREHNSGVTFAMGCQRVRNAATRDEDDSGGYRSRGPVLWAMRVLKVEDWLLTHADCRPPPRMWETWDDWDEKPF